jgi:hypothetical protein
VGFRPGTSHLSSETFPCDGEFPTPPTHSAPNVAWYLLSLRTDSVNRGICISFSTLATVVLVVPIKSLFFFIPK